MSIDRNQIDPKYQSLGAGLNVQVNNPFFGIATTGTLAQRTVSQALLRIGGWSLHCD